jgi:uncharacterized protein
MSFNNVRRNRRDCSECDPSDCDCPLFLFPSLLRVMALTHPRRGRRPRTTNPARAGIVAIRGYQR